MKSSIFTTIVLLFLAHILYGQSTYTIAGRVIDSTGSPLIAATTVVIDPIDSTMVTYGITNEDGSFILPSVPLKSLRLQITYIGYGSFEQPIDPPSSGKFLQVGDVILSRDNVLLKEVVVKASHIPVAIHGDTILYNADAFKTGSNDAVEDLLKKLPGIEVSPSGEIKAQGESVGKVLVDGKEFFGNDPRMATKNLPANIVDKVAVFDKKSDESQFSGINDGQEVKTIDLKLKEDKKNGVFGKVSAGYGSNDRFSGKAQINRFSPKMQLSLIGNGNNINDIGFQNNVSELATGGGIVIVQGGNNQGNSTASGINRALSSGINFNYDFSKALKIRSSYLYKNLYNDLAEQVNSTYLNPERAFNSSEDSRSKTRDSGHNLNLTLEFDKDTTWQGRLTSRLNAANGFDDITSNLVNALASGSALSSSMRTNLVADNNFDFTNNFSLRKRLKKPGSIFSFSGSGNQTNSSGEEEVRANILEANNAMQLAQLQERDIKTLDFTGNASLSWPLGKGRVVSASIAGGSENQTFSKDFYEISNGQNQIIPGLGGLADKQFNRLVFGGTFNKNLDDERSFNFSLSGQISSLDFSQNSILKKPDSRTFYHLLPGFSFIKNAKSGSYNFGYRSQVKSPEIYQMASMPDNSNPLFLYLGNGDLIPEYIHRINAQFHKYDAFYFRNHMAFASLSYTLNPIVNARNSDENYVTTFRPVNGKFALNGLANYSYGAPSIIPKVKYNTDLTLTYFEGSSYVNQLESVNKRWAPSIGITVENKTKNNLDMSLNYQAEYTFSSYTSELINDVSYLNQRWRAHLEWYITKDITIGGDYQFRKYSVESISTDNTLQYLNCFLSVDLGKKKRWTLDIKGNDLLNQNSGIERNASPLLISERSYSGLGRYVMASVTYALSDFKPKGMFIMR